jgi:peroxiredoxin
MRGAGDSVPQVTFKLRRNAAWQEVTSDAIFRGRTVVVLALPAAFSTACSARHLPGYIALARNIKAMGVDEICCIAVNDAFVMSAWARDQGVADEVTLLPDGNGDFTRAMGMLVDHTSLGFGQRSWRYSMLVRDGVISRIFVEDAKDGGEAVAVSDAITMLDYLDSLAPAAAAG